MNKVNLIIDELLVIKHRKKISNVQIQKALKLSIYKIQNVFAGTGNIDDLAKIYDYLKEAEAEKK